MNRPLQKTILLVEDEAIVGMNVSKDLKNYGYDVIHVFNGQQAIDTVNDISTEIHLILMDIDLGREIDGPETAKIIIKDHEIPVLFLSSHVEREIVEKTENITSYGYVVKNSGITVLDASIKMAFKLHDAYIILKNQKIEIEEHTNKLQFSEKRYRRLFESAKDGILILDADNGMIVDVNPFLIAMLGYSKEEFLNKFIWEINAFNNIDYSKHLFKELQDKDYIRYTDLPLETVSGSLVHVEFVSNVYLVENNRVIQCNIRDITDRLRYEKTLTNNIDEKEALLKEIQHRTKNSFHMITSLISLRSTVTKSAETKETLEDLSFRVKSISDLYTLLYETDSIIQVHLRTYCGRVIESMLNLTKNVEVVTDFDEITISTKNAATLGMIIVELLSNSIKYAFPDSEKGTINIKIKNVNSKLLLSVEDNGIGLQKDFSLAENQGLGLRLVDAMVRQLDGNMKFTTDNGTKVEIECDLQ